VVAVSHDRFLSSFVGRREELRDVRDLVLANPLVTLLGVGGLGKTRLAYRAYDDLTASVDGAWSVDLADLVEAPLLGATVAAAMEVPAPADEHDVTPFVDLVGERSALLLLDNCEHLVDACASFVATLLTRCPNLHVLTTSRQALDVLGERVYLVPALNAEDAVELFGQRASSALTTWSLSDQNRDSVGALCTALEAVPLAIELAAVQIRTFTPPAMLARLADSTAVLGGALRGEPSRRRSMEACIQWSHDLCNEDERLLWSRLSVFSGGFSLDAVEEVCAGPGLPRDQILGALAGLIDKSLVRRDPGDVDARYRMLEVIRQFGRARLVDSGELTEWRRRHRDYFLVLAERFDADWISPRQLEWIGLLHREHANVRAAMEFGVHDPDEAPLAMRMCGVLEHFFTTTGGGGEALHWIELALAHSSGTPLERASALRVGAFIAVLMSDLDVAGRMTDALNGLAAQAGDDEVTAFALFAEAFLRTWQDDPVTGAARAAAAIDLFEKNGDLSRSVNLKFCRGMMLSWAERRDEAASAYAHFFEVARPRGERWHTGYALWSMGLDALIEGRVDEAVALERQALQDKVEFGDLLCIGLTLEVLAWAGAEQGHGRDAAVLLGAAEAIWAFIGMPIASMPFLSHRRELGVAATTALLSGSEFQELVERGRAMPLPDAIELALGRARQQQLTGLLTRREREIAQLVAAGATNKDIADRLVLSVRTVETHVDHILRKLELGSRGEVAGVLAQDP